MKWLRGKPKQTERFLASLGTSSASHSYKERLFPLCAETVNLGVQARSLWSLAMTR
jgi:hypothetical protein